jgi:tetratricopeptide (TPR) repeat protein
MKHYEFARGLEEAGEISTALEELRTAHRLQKELIDKAGANLHHLEELAGTETTLGKILAVVQGNPEGIPLLRNAHAVWKELAERHPEKPAFSHNRKIALHHMGHHFDNADRLDELEDVYRELLALSPEKSEALHGLAWFLLLRPERNPEKDAEALRLAKKAVELTPKMSVAWSALALAHYRAGQWEKAAEAHKKSMDLRETRDVGDWFILAMVTWQLGKQEEARTWYEKAIAGMEELAELPREARQFRAETEAILGIPNSVD